ncbi:hypothetical protein BKA67DRAFT_576454, partial [Truncatella angustata]
MKQRLTSGSAVVCRCHNGYGVILCGNKMECHLGLSFSNTYRAQEVLKSPGTCAIHRLHVDYPALSYHFRGSTQVMGHEL